MTFPIAPVRLWYIYFSLYFWPVNRFLIGILIQEYCCIPELDEIQKLFCAFLHSVPDLSSRESCKICEVDSIRFVLSLNTRDTAALDHNMETKGSTEPQTGCCWQGPLGLSGPTHL